MAVEKGDVQAYLRIIDERADEYLVFADLARRRA
jgi:hypothetical protein